MANNKELIGDFVQTTDIFDTLSTDSTEVTSSEFKELVFRLRERVNNIALSLNGRDSGIYTKSEFVNGQTWDQTAAGKERRQVFRKVINFGALPNTTTKTSAHGITITANTSFTRIYATASDAIGSSYIPIPYASATAIDIVELSVDATNISITTGKDQSAFTICYVVIEYLKQ